MLNNSSKNKGMPSFVYMMALKLLLIVGTLTVVIVAILNFFFLDQLSASRINQVRETAESVSNILSELTVNGIISGDHDLVKLTVENTIDLKRVRESGLIQISVILLPSGIYYASTNQEFANKKASQSLLNKIGSSDQPGVSSELLNYELNNRTITVLQFLKNVTIQQNNESKRVAAVQILFDYKKLVNKTRLSLLIIGAVALIGFFIIVLVLLAIVSSVYRKVFEGFHQIGRKNFGYRIPVKSNDESAVLFGGFNKMNAELKRLFKEKRSAGEDDGMGTEGEVTTALGDHSLRKAEITCLVARIPAIQEYIEEKTPEAVDDHISELIIPMEKIVKEYGGQVIKVLGDKIYAFFEGINSVDNSIRSALKLAQSWETANHERKVLDRDLLNFGIGLHSTDGIAGSLVGSEYQYTFIGQAASIAEFLCACAKREQVLISSSMMDRASGAYQYQILQEIGAGVIPEKDEVLSITLLTTDEEKHERMKKLEGSLMDTASNDQLDVNVQPSGANRQGASYDASVTNMLEETLTTTPLESIKDEEVYFDNMEEQDSLDESDDGKSLWDSVDSRKDK